MNIYNESDNTHKFSRLEIANMGVVFGALISALVHGFMGNAPASVADLMVGLAAATIGNSRA